MSISSLATRAAAGAGVEEELATPVLPSSALNPHLLVLCIVIRPFRGPQQYPSRIEVVAAIRKIATLSMLSAITIAHTKITKKERNITLSVILGH